MSARVVSTICSMRRAFSFRFDFDQHRDPQDIDETLVAIFTLSPGEPREDEVEDES